MPGKMGATVTEEKSQLLAAGLVLPDDESWVNTLFFFAYIPYIYKLYLYIYI
jgi:hypothetical protein